METLMRTGAQSLNASSLSARDSTRNLSPCSTSGSSVQSVQAGSFVRLKALNRSLLRQRFKPSRESVRPFRIRAEQSGIDEKVREIASDEAVEGPETLGRDAESKANELKSGQEESSELPVAAELLLNVLKEEDESIESGVEKEAALDVASDSAVEDPQTFFHDVEEDAKQLSADLGRSVEDEIVGLEEKAEDLEERQVKEAEVVKEEQFHEVSSTTAEVNSSKGELTREQVQDKLLETAQDGFEVLKWAAEGVVSAGQNARQGLGVAQEALNKRLKSFGIAADETRDVSSQVAEVAQKNFQELHTSASKFGEELQVNIEEKKAADSLKPESDQSPLGQLNENLSKAAQAGKDFSTRVSERAEEIYAKSSEDSKELADKTKENAEELVSEVSQPADNLSSVKYQYEDERGNEFIKGQISTDDKEETSKFDIDEAQAVPSRKQDESDIGHDE